MDMAICVSLRIHGVNPSLLPSRLGSSDLVGKLVEEMGNFKIRLSVLYLQSNLVSYPTLGGDVG